MTKPAAFMGVYTDLKFLSGLKVARVTLEIPIERSQEFIGMFGTPDKTNPAWCAIARLNVGNGAPGGAVAPAASADQAKDQDKPRTYTNSQIAALKCRDAEFQIWLGVDGNLGPEERIAQADEILKDRLQILSKRAIDTNPLVTARWNQLIASFDYRNAIR